MDITRHLPIILTSALVAVLPWVYSSHVTKRAKNIEILGDFAESQFRTAKLFIFLAWTVIIAALALVPISWVLVKNHRDKVGGLFLLGGIAFVFLFFGVCCLYRLKKAKIEFSHDKFFVKYGKIEQTIALDKIRNAYASTWFIIVDTGGKFKIAIPMIFADNCKILAMLRSCCKRKQCSI